MPTSEQLERARQKAAAKWAQKYADLGPPPLGKPSEMALWLTNAAGMLAYEALKDFGSTDSGRERRRHAMTMIKWASETIDSATIAAELNDLYDAIKAADKAGTPVKGGKTKPAKGSADAAPIPSAEARVSKTPTH